jgi:hypothetical protein
MNCIELMNGLDISCLITGKFYYQNVVLINKSDVDQSTINIDGKNTINFNLKDGACGFLFASNQKRRLISGKFTKAQNNSIVFYDHELQIPIIGTHQEIKVLLRQLDEGEFFGAIHHVNGDIEIYGFEYGLKTNPWNYEAQGELGGSIISLSSEVSEEFPPLNYIPTNVTVPNTSVEQAIINFNNLFCGLAPFLFGDFNNDFNNDFYITQ